MRGRSDCPSRGCGPPELEPRLRDGRDDRVEHVVRRALLREGLVREDEAMTEGVLDERPDVSGITYRARG